jgi:hypothetical protein
VIKVLLVHKVPQEFKELLDLKVILVIKALLVIKV